MTEKVIKVNLKYVLTYLDIYKTLHNRQGRCLIQPLYKKPSNFNEVTGIKILWKGIFSAEFPKNFGARKFCKYSVFCAVSILRCLSEKKKQKWLWILQKTD